MVLATLIQIVWYWLSFFIEDMPSSFLPDSASSPAVTDEYSNLKYVEMMATPTEGGEKYLAMASFYNEDYWIGKCSATIFRSTYETKFDRPDGFKQNPAIPAENQPTTHDYSYSGYDRGHLSPNADNSYNYEAQLQSFYVTNIAPQDSWTNENPWAALEGDLREFAQGQTKDLFIVTCTHGKDSTIDDAKIVVPAYYYKLVCALDEAQDYPTAAFYGLNSKSTETDRDARTATIETLRKPADMLKDIGETYDAMNEFISQGGFSEVPASCGQSKDLNTAYWSALPFVSSSRQDYV